MAVLNWFISIVKSVLNTLARVFVVLVLVAVVIAVVEAAAGDGLPGNMVLTLDLRQQMDDKSVPDIFGLTGLQVSVMDAVLGLDAAARDDRVKGVFIRMGSGNLSIPKAEELRDAIKRFKMSDKFVIAHSQSFYSGGLGDYDIAVAADEIWMQPASSFFASGTASTTLFFRGLFDNIDAVPQFTQRYEYKNAANSFTETDFTPEHREASMRVLQSWYDTAISEIAADREVDEATLTAFLDQSPATVEEVREAGLITAIGYDDEAADAALERAGADAELTEFSEYLRRNPATRQDSGDAIVAFVHAAGEILEGGATDPLSAGDVVVAGDTFARAIREATEDEDVEAILMRVDSPGGSAIASDQILDALKKAQAAGKPVVVSMGAVAASGGYYISLAADRIIAHPGTLTGSIGVFWGKITAGATLESIGVAARELGVGNNATFLSGFTPWNTEQLEEVGVQADAIYDDFTRKVAEGRTLPPERVDEIARGRVWTGADALDRGLVDELGGFWTAVEHVRELAGIAPDARIAFRTYPAPRGFVDRLGSFVDTSSAGLAVIRGLNRLMASSPFRALLAAVLEAPRGAAEMRAVGLPGE